MANLGHFYWIQHKFNFTLDGWVDELMDGWMGGWMDGWLSQVKDCLQQSKSAIGPSLLDRPSQGALYKNIQN